MRIVSRTILFIIIVGMLPVTFACNKTALEPFNPKVPIIETIALQRGGSAIADEIIYSGELITVTITAHAQSVIGDCYNPQISTGNVDLDAPTPLTYTFEIIPPPVTKRTGELTKDVPPGNIAKWRVPKVDDITGHEQGLTYTIRVSAFDDCLNLTTTGQVTVNVFSDKGPPLITSLDCASRADGVGIWALEDVDLNNYFEVQPSDEVRLRATATSESDPSLCSGLGVSPSRSLYYAWAADITDINITIDPDPVENKTVYFDVPEILKAHDAFTVTMTVTDICSGAITERKLHFIVVGPPIIVSATAIADGYEVKFNLYSGYYEVEPGAQSEIVANTLNADPLLCSWEGYVLTREYSWEETIGSSPKPNLVFETLPEVDNDRSRLTFISPKATNGTKYDFRLTVTDRCNGLTTSKDYPFLIIVAPTLGDTTVMDNSSAATYNNITGRYEVHQGHTISVTQEATPASDTTFCSGRGINQDESLEYKWDDDLKFFNFIYDPIPDPDDQSKVHFKIPMGAAGNIDTLTVTVTDRCNGLSVTRAIVFKVIS